MKMTLVRSFITSATMLLLAACSAKGGPGEGEGVMVRQITQSAYCGLTGPGVAFLRSEADREALLDVSGQNMATDVVRKVDLSREALVMVTLGQKPTAGYSVGLQSALAQGKSLVLDMRVSEPAPDMMVAQVITSPCVVLAVEPRGWQQIRVRGVTEQPLVRTLEN
ncbi:protease complex subunit PrcB family protein [Marinobacter hydrocarbonoclasticus]|uniref:protease complex subunit PrcB family protein n=1 Tax=Marinobacter nauticus TaxID=2743 RepID=UPI001C9503A2|nr:protease complex subunit PrcB family protein [Marinobacter nauticus]MBY6192710.1 protease complex subunit PrcB family protein [Marinobacter nauticus]MBY6213858.1 protease complex subunit PrcB family protein [Marinobacter nauticus]